jgi:hypothetical protein
MRPLIFLLAITSLLTAAPRPWKDPEGTRSIQGEFVSRESDRVTIRRTDGKVFTMTLDKLHPDDRKWLEANHPLALSGTNKAPANAVFDSLCFGDTRQQVTAKLKESKFVELTANETFLGRLGLNGVFRTRKDVGGLPCMLYFDWTEEGQLKELSLQTNPLGEAAYGSRIKNCWTELIKLLTSLYGKPLQAANYPDAAQLTEGAFLASHLWSWEGGGSILLGTARDAEGFTAVVRFTKKEIAPVTLP